VLPRMVGSRGARDPRRRHKTRFFPPSQASSRPVRRSRKPWEWARCGATSTMCSGTVPTRTWWERRRSALTVRSDAVVRPSSISTGRSIPARFSSVDGPLAGAPPLNPKDDTESVRAVVSAPEASSRGLCERPSACTQYSIVGAIIAPFGSSSLSEEERVADQYPRSIDEARIVGGVRNEI